MENIKQLIKDFLEGKIEIIEFKELCNKDDSIYGFLQKIIDNIKTNNGIIEEYPFPSDISPEGIHYSDECVRYLLVPETDPSLKYGCPPHYNSVKQMLNYEWNSYTTNVRTASGALTFFNEVLVIYYQIDKTVIPTEKYSDEYDFALQVIPEYLEGGDAEIYIQEHIIPLFPATMKKTLRIKAVKQKIKEEFKTEKGYPRWYQSSEWPLGKDGKPATYIGKGKSEGELGRWLFRDESNGEIIVVEQYD